MGRVKELLNDANGLPDLPEGALEEGQISEINNDWLRQADEQNKIDAMIHWFLSRFCDPAEETPYMSSEGGYIWIHGGPYDAMEEIETRFHEYVDFDTIEKAADSVQSDGIFEWAPTRLMYLGDYDLEIEDRNEPTQKLEATIDKLKEILNLTGNDAAREVARNLAYSGIIGALETFLWETMKFWLTEKPEFVERIIKNHPFFRDTKIKLSQIYSYQDQLPELVMAYMRNIVWHRADQVGPMFKHGLDVSIGLNTFETDIKKRHDIVHRLGVDIDGNAVIVTDDDVYELADRVIQFATKVNEKIEEASNSPPF